jgi:hypothetical protein
MPLPVLRSTRSLDQYLAAARIVENTTPIDDAGAERTASANDAVGAVAGR